MTFYYLSTCFDLKTISIKLGYESIGKYVCKYLSTYFWDIFGWDSYAWSANLNNTSLVTKSSTIHA